VLTRIYDASAPGWLRDIPAVTVLRQVWVQQFYTVALETPMRWRVAEDLPPASRLISSPYDPEARYSKKRETEWVGYNVHLTETCDPDQPHLLTDVQTTFATTPDHALTGVIQTALAARDLAPGDHLVDAGYVTAERLVDSQQAHTDLIGPVPPEPGWQAKAGEGFAASCFVIDWEAQQATCPQGKVSRSWKPKQDQDGHAAVLIRFAPTDCRTCPLRPKCVSSTRERSLCIRDHDHYVALQAARQRQHTDLFKALYRGRAGAEGTISQGTRTSDLRRSRYIGLVKTRLLHLLIATALNFMRLAAWLADTPHAQTRCSAFAKLAPVPT
jgi:transposase